MGRGAARKAEDLQTQAANKFMGLANQNLAQSTPWLKQSGDYYSSIADGDFNKMQRYVAPQVNATRSVYDQAQRQIERNAPKGGFRDSAIAGLQTAQAGDISRIATGGIQDALSRLGALGQGGQQLSISGLGGAGASADSIARLASARGAAIGQGIGGIASAAGWIIGGGK